MGQKSGLVVRQYERQELELPLEFVICDEHQPQVRFSRTSAAAGQHIVRGHSVDLSSGGIGMNTHQFLPRMCEGTIRVFDPTPVGERHDGSPLYEVAFEHQVKVRRVQMVGHDPVYFVGMAFRDPEPDLDERLTVLLQRIGVLDADGCDEPDA